MTVLLKGPAVNCTDNIEISSNCKASPIANGCSGHQQALTRLLFQQLTQITGDETFKTEISKQARNCRYLLSWHKLFLFFI